MSSNRSPDSTEKTNIKAPKLNSRIVMRYVLVQALGWALLGLCLLIIQKWEKLPAWFIWGLVALWIAKDAILFPFVWRSYDWSHPSDEFNSLIGTEGTAMEPLTPSGYIKIRGELWKAVVANENAPVEKGEAIRVKGNQGLTLIVEPVREISPHNRSSSDI